MVFQYKDIGRCTWHPNMTKTLTKQYWVKFLGFSGPTWHYMWSLHVKGLECIMEHCWTWIASLPLGFCLSFFCLSVTIGILGSTTETFAQFKLVPKFVKKKTPLELFLVRKVSFPSNVSDWKKKKKKQDLMAKAYLVFVSIYIFFSIKTSVLATEAVVE